MHPSSEKCKSVTGTRTGGDRGPEYKHAKLTKAKKLQKPQPVQEQPQCEEKEEGECRSTRGQDFALLSLRHGTALFDPPIPGIRRCKNPCMKAGDSWHSLSIIRADEKNARII